MTSRAPISEIYCTLSANRKRVSSMYNNCNYWKKSYFALVRAAFNIEGRNTKTKVLITLANHIGHRQSSKPIKT